MKALIISIAVLSALSANSADTLFAWVRTNRVIDVEQYDTNAPPVIPTNIVAIACPTWVVPGCWYNTNGFFLDTNQQPFSAARSNALVRIQWIDQTVADATTALNAWSTLSATNQNKVLQRCVQAIKLILLEHRKDYLLDDSQ